MKRLIYVVLFFALFGHRAGAFVITPEMQATCLRTVVISTVGGEEPVCESVVAPEGSWGIGITNVNKVPGRVLVLEPDGSAVYDSGEYLKKESGMTVKVRGNTSARFAKKPFKIKLEKKGDMMGRGDKSLNDKNWVLLTSGNNLYQLGFLIGKWIGMSWAPACEYVHLVMNDDYRGVYILAEAVERNAECRIVTDESGFVAERDPYWWNEDGQYLPSGWHPQFNWTMKYPDFEDLTDATADYISEVLRNFENIITTENYEDLIDVDSFCKWLIAQDILGTSDGGGTNFYLARKDDMSSSRLYVPVLWDVDSGEDTVDAWSNVHYESMIAPLFNNRNTAFSRRYVELYRELSPSVWRNVESLVAELRSGEWEGFDKAAQLNNGRWGDSAVQYSSSENADHMEWWFPARKKWLDKAVDALEIALETDGIPCPVESSSVITVYSLEGIELYRGPEEDYTPPAAGIYIIRNAEGAGKLIKR